MAAVLLIDDDANLSEVVRFILAESGHEVIAAGSGEQGLAALDGGIDLVITDVRMPGMDGMEVLRRIQERDDLPPPPVIVLTAHGTVEQAVQAMKAGAFSYLLKPFGRDELRLVVAQALHTRELERDNARLRNLLRDRPQPAGIIYRSQAMGRLLQDLERAAASDASVLLTGESGAGKELVARACHELSPRRDRPFVALNCGAIPAGLIEAELFGHTRGAYTGATAAAPGRIRGAHGGTLFLDEIGELPPPLQPKLLRVLDTRQVDPVGGGPAQTVDFRLVCATNRDLEAEIAAGRFREDLWYRINVVRLHVPALRERPEDIPVLWEHYTALHGGRGLLTEPELAEQLLRWPWRGNVRELKNLNQRLVLMRRSEALTLADWRRLAPPAAGPAAPGAADPQALDDGDLPLGPLPPQGLSLIALEKEVIRRALRLCGGNRSRTAAYLGIPRHVLLYRLQKYGLE